MPGLLAIFASPGQVFADVREGRRSWVAPFVASLLIALLVSVTVIQLVGYENIVRKSIERNPLVASRLDPAQMEQAIQAANAPWRRNLSYAGSVIGTGVALLVLAAIFTGILSLMDSRAPFPKTLAVTSYSYYVYLLIAGVLSIIVLMLMSDRTDANVGNLLMFNIGAFLDRETTNRFVYSLATSFDLLTIGLICLYSYGISQLVPRVSFGKVFAAIGSLWLVWVLLKAGLALAFGSFF